MSVTSISTQDALHNLLEQCRYFPPSVNESTMLYHYTKLMMILQRKELAGIEKDADLIANAYTLSMRFTAVSRSILKNVGEQDMENYRLVDHAIEQQLTGNMYIFAKQWGLSVKALYYHKVRNYKKAVDVSLECIILNEYLIREGVSSLLFRAAEQVKNIVRVFFKSGDYESGATLAYQLLNYLFNGEPGSLYGTIFKDRSVWDQIPYVREGYAYDCFKAMVYQMIHFEKTTANTSSDVFSKLFDGLSLDITTPDRQIIGDWLDMKRCYRQGRSDEFLCSFADFMSEPLPTSYEILKIDLFSDIIHLVDASRHPEKDGMLQELNQYIESRLNASYHLGKDISAKNLVSLDPNPL